MSRFHKPAIAALLVLAGSLAFAALVGDSATYDEPSHLTSGFSYLHTGDFRLAPDHPPLAKMWAALPVVAMQPQWDGEPREYWRVGNVWPIGSHWLFSSLNDGQRLIVAARCMIVVLLLVTLLCVYALGRALFGPAAGLLALTLAALCPTMLAHGHYVTTDMPATLLTLATLLAYWRALQRMTVLRGALACAAFAALTLTKFLWPLVIPALAAMTIAMLTRPKPHGLRAWKLALWVAAGGVVSWLAIWTCYGWHYSPFRGPDASSATMLKTSDPSLIATQNNDDVWRAVTIDHNGKPIGGLTMAMVSFAREHRLFPEAYLYGLAFTAKTTLGRASYVLGQYPIEGTPKYFPLAFAIKTPLATVALFLIGSALLITRRIAIREPALLFGLLTFAAVYGISAVASGLNIGHRHLLPLYPIVYVLAGSVAAALWTPRPDEQVAAKRRGTSVLLCRAAVLTAVAWLGIANLWTFPNYLSYFNESIGGPSHGAEYLADSNIDWGQDLLRLADYARRHPNETIKLSYFGSADPAFYVPTVQRLAGVLPAGRFDQYDAGTYVFSLTQLLGVEFVPARGETWTREIGAAYAQQFRAFGGLPPGDPVFSRDRAAMQFIELRAGRLMNGLRSRPPDIRIGASMVGWRLSKDDVDRLIAP